MDAAKTSPQYRAMVPYTLNPSTYPPERNLLLRNDGGVFREIGRRAGVDNLSGRSLSASWCDFDGDGWPDLYVANDISDKRPHDGLLPSLALLGLAALFAALGARYLRTSAG